MGLDEILDMAKKMNISMPKMLFVAAIEVKDPFSFGEELTPEVEEAVPRVALEITGLIKEKCLGQV